MGFAVREVSSEQQTFLRRNSLQPEPEIAASTDVFDIDDLDAGCKVLLIGEWSGICEGVWRVVHGAFNEDGTGIRFSVWNARNRESAILIVDGRTLEPRPCIRVMDILTPTGKFNVPDTRPDIH